MVAQRSTASPVAAVRRSTRSPATRSSLSLARAEAADDVLSLAGPSSVRSSRRSRKSGSIMEEVEESPTDAPGGGRRISVPLSSAVASSAQLQSALGSEGPAPASSSPLARKARKSDMTGVIARRRSPRHRTSNAPTSDDADELSPSRLRDKVTTAHSSRANRRKSNDENDIEVVSASPDESEVREDEAEEINETEAAKALGRKRPRRSKVRDASLQLGSDDQTREEASVAPKRKRGRPSNSPATQKQPAQKPKPRKRRHSAATGRTKAKAPPRRRRRKSDDAGDSNRTVEVTVQRFVQRRTRRAGDEADPLHIDLPFANRSGESSVDVFAQVCDEVISATVNQFQEHIDTAGDRARQKEYRIKKRAVEAYQEVLHGRMLEHVGVFLDMVLLL
jgi:hypothetical protein